MALLEQCTNCGRLGGYAESENDKICARCKRDRKKPKFDDKGTFVAEAGKDK